MQQRSIGEMTQLLKHAREHARRDGKGFTVSEVAEALGISPSRVKSMENAERKDLRSDLVIAMACLYGVTIQYLSFEDNVGMLPIDPASKNEYPDEVERAAFYLKHVLTDDMREDIISTIFNKVDELRADGRFRLSGKSAGGQASV